MKDIATDFHSRMVVPFHQAEIQGNRDQEEEDGECCPP